jgi:hypothetical protein
MISAEFGYVKSGGHGGHPDEPVASARDCPCGGPIGMIARSIVPGDHEGRPYGDVPVGAANLCRMTSDTP